MPENFTPADFVKAGTDSALARVHTVMAGRIVTYYPLTQTADIAPVTKEVRFNSLGVKSYEPYPIIPNVKIQFPRCKNWYISFPLDTDDYVTLHFSEANLGEWRENGGDSLEPADARRFSLSSPIAVPGVVPDLMPLSIVDPLEVSARAAGIVLGKDGSVEQIRMADGSIKIGAQASDFAALASLVMTNLVKLQAAFDAHVHATAGTGAPSPPTAVPGVIPVGTLAPVAAAITKVQ